MTLPDRVAGAKGRAFGADPACGIKGRWRPGRPGGGRTELTRGRNPADGGLSQHCFAHTLLVPAAVVTLRPVGTQMSPPLGGIGSGAARPPAPRRSSRGRAAPAAPATGPAPPTAAAQAQDPQDLGEQQRPGLGHDPRPVSGHDDLGTARGIVHGKSAFGRVRTGPSTSPILPVQRHFSRKRPRLIYPRRKSEARKSLLDHWDAQPLACTT